MNLRPLGTLIVLVGLPAAIWHIVATSRTAGEVKQISRDLTTRYIGEYPRASFLHEIVSILREANHRILIACDFPAYANCSDPVQYTEYKSVLDEKSPAMEIRLVVLDGSQRDGLLETYFPDRLPLNRLNQSCLEGYRNKGHAIQSMREARLAMRKEQAGALKGFSSWAQPPKETEGPMPLYVWIADERAAVFVIPPVGRDKRETGFLTRDLRLIQQLEKVFNSYW